jgi:lipoprotein-anchoring transpeptidase ErfK/SrfK
VPPPDTRRERQLPPDDYRERVRPPERDPARPAPRFDEPTGDMDELPADESAARKLLAPPSRGVLIGGIAGLALLLLGGLAAFFLWPSSKTARPVATPAPAPATTTTTTTPATRQRSPATQVVNYVYLRQPVYYRTTHPVGTMIVDKSQNFLYVVRPNVVAIRYGIGTGAECNSAAGLYKVTRKEEYPGLKSNASAEDRANNPLGARALYLDTAYRMHGTNAPQMIGRFAPLGCIRLSNEDIIELYNNTPLETRVVVTD